MTALKAVYHYSDHTLKEYASNTFTAALGRNPFYGKVMNVLLNRCPDSFLYPPSQDEIYLTFRTRSTTSSPHLCVLWWKSHVFTGVYSRSHLACDARTLRWPQRKVIGWGDQVAPWVPHSVSVRDVALSPVWSIKHLYSILLVKQRGGFITKPFENQVKWLAISQLGPRESPYTQASAAPSPGFSSPAPGLMACSSFKTENHMHNYHLTRICISKQASCPCLSWGFLSTFTPLSTTPGCFLVVRDGACSTSTTVRRSFPCLPTPFFRYFILVGEDVSPHL